MGGETGEGVVTVARLPADPATRLALRRVLRHRMARDPVDAADDAALLAGKLDQRVKGLGHVFDHRDV